MNVFDTIEKDVRTKNYISTLDNVYRNRLISVLQRICISKEKRLDSLINELNSKQWKICVQITPRLMDCMNDDQLEFVIRKPTRPNKLRCRHKMLCKRFKIDIRVHHSGYDKNEYNKVRYLKTKGINKPRARVLQLIARMKKAILDGDICKTCHKYILPFIEELEEIARETNPQKK